MANIEGVGVQNILNKMKYLQASAFTVSQNIAQADIPGTRRQTLRPFEQIMRNTNKRGGLNLTHADTLNTGEMIHKEREVLDLHNISNEYSALTQIYRRYHEMIRIAIGKA